MTQPILSIEHLTHLYPDGSSGITDISFEIAVKEFILLAGRNGSGKTTLIRHLNGLLRPDRGCVRFQGRDIFKDLVNTRKKVGMVFQDPDTQIIGETVSDEVAFGPENLGWSRAVINEKVQQALEQMDLYDLRHRHPSALSGGEKRRLAIAGILVMDPSVIIFDEPFANLDYPGVLSLMDIIVRLNRSGTTIIMATHDLAPALPHAHRLLVMDHGVITASGAPDTLAPDMERFGLRPVTLCPDCGNPCHGQTV